MALKSGQRRVSRDGHRLTSKAIALPVPFSKLMSVSEIWFHRISYWPQEKMWVEGNSLQQVRLRVVLDGIWYKCRDWQGERVKKTLRRGTVERNPPNLCEKHSRVKNIPPHRALLWSKIACPCVSPSKSSCFHRDFAQLRAPCKHNAHVLTLGQSNWKTEQIF